MALKKPHQLEPGMILKTDVFNMDGEVLFSKGVALTERQIDILQQWGVPNVEIEGGEEETEKVDLDQFSPEIVERAEQNVADRFKLVKSTHPAVEIIRKLCVTQEADAISKHS